MYNLRPSYLEVDISAIDYNIKQIKSRLEGNCKIMPVIKADAYGSGVDKFKNVILDNSIDIVAVAIADEGQELRKCGFDMPIVILNQSLEEEIPKIVDYNLTPGVAVYDFVEKLDAYSKKVGKITNIHIEIDTGMGRVGLFSEQVLNFISKVKKLDNINVEGIYTHFSSADYDREYTINQIKKFNDVLKTLEEENIKVKYRHASNSAGIIEHSEAQYDLVRPGIILHGYLPDESLKGKIDLKPSLKLKSKISFIKSVPKNTAISYGQTYITNREKTIIATVPIGYDDGINRKLSNNGKVIIKGKEAPIVGKICMDSFMIDISDIQGVNIGDEVIIFDNEHIKLEELAKKCETISYEIMTGISRRVPRKYLN